MRKLPSELGDLIEVHRPLSWWKGWAWTLLIPNILIGASMIAGGVDSWDDVVLLTGLYAGLAIPCVIAFAEMFLIKFRIYRRGIVFSCDLSFPYGYKDYVLPYWRCDPDSLKALRRGKETEAAVEGFVGQHYRLIPLAAYNLQLEGPMPGIASEIGSGKEPFELRQFREGVSEAFRRDLIRRSSANTSRRWLFTSRDPHRHVELLDQLIRAEHERLGLTDRAESDD